MFSKITDTNINTYDDFRVSNLDTPAKLVFEPNSSSQNNAGAHQMYIHIARSKNPIDSLTEFFTFTINVLNPVDCVPNLTLPDNIVVPSPYSYEY